MITALLNFLKPRRYELLAFGRFEPRPYHTARFRNLEDAHREAHELAAATGSTVQIIDRHGFTLILHLRSAL